MIDIHPLPTVLLTAALSAAPAAAVAVSPYGVNVHAPAGTDLTRVVERSTQAGIDWLRIDFVWALVELEPGLYDWSRYDEIVDAATRRGLDLLAIVAYTPDWATDGPELSGVPRDPRRWSEFCRRAATRYRGRIRAWEIWNEPNLDHFWAGTRRQYLDEILLPGAVALRSGDPAAVLAGPALAHLRSGDSDWYRWLQEVVATAGSSIDVLTHHAYDGDGHLAVTEKLDGDTPFGTRPELWDVVEPSLREVLEQSGWTGPVWLTETGWASDEVGEEAQAIFVDGLLQQWLTEDAERSWLGAIFFYELEDGDDSGFPRFGLLRSDGTAKPAFWALSDFIAAHPPPSNPLLELHDGRFAVEVDYRDPHSGAAVGTPVPLTESTGAFWFFEPGSLDLVVKVLDGGAINGSYWVFFGALSDVEYEVRVRDRATDRLRTYRNPAGILCGQSDVGAFPLQGVSTAGTTLERSGPMAKEGPDCSTSSELCLHAGRFRVAVDWRDPKDGVRRPATVRPQAVAAETGLFWFFDPANVELALKILDGRGVNGRFWVLAGALSDVEYWVRVADGATGVIREYHNPAGTLCGFADIEAF